MPGQQPSPHAACGSVGGAGGARARDQHRTGPAEAWEALDRLAHDALVVTGLAAADEDEEEEEAGETDDGGDPDATEALDADA